MSIANFYNSILLIVLIVELISNGSCCSDIEWACDSGQCIASDELCDGNTDCSDGSDETADVCIQQSCPSFAFRCAYGACVAGSAECNGIRECADNSDETSSLCPDDLNTRNTLCQDEQFQCTSGECIDLDNACDGHSDCKDQSDETVEACASFNCPTFAFRCGYGACISKTKKCNGVPDCRDGSDETRKLCGEKPPPKPPTVTPPFVTGPTKPTKRPPLSPPTKAPVQGCKAPNIAYSILKYETEPTKIIQPGETISDGTSMVYECIAGYNREGPQFNLCFESKWYSVLDANCVKYCPHHTLKGVTFRAECQKDGVSVSCDDRIRPGTFARIFCQHKYRKPDRNPPDILVCQEDGQWDYEPFRCEPVCGKELLQSTAFSVNGIDTNITYVPWHAGIYQNFAGKFKHVCGATIISAKVLITAAHCFWDFANQKTFDKSYYVVGAGKYLRDYYATERNAEFKNISEIATPSDFRGEIDNYKSDIAVLVLTNFLKFSPYIGPACIEWQQAAAKAIASNIYGQIPGWGIDNSGDFSKVLRTIDVPSSSYSDCRDAVGTELANAVSYDKFCVINTSGSVVCQGDSGGGFIVKTLVNGEYINYLWGVVSGGVPQGSKCSEFVFVSYTNIQYFESLIMSRMNSNRPK